MKKFCENCSSEKNHRLCKGCHITMTEENEAVYSKFSPSEAALELERINLFMFNQAKKIIKSVRELAVKYNYADNGVLIHSLKLLQKHINNKELK